MTSPDGAGLPDKEDVGGWAGGSTGPLAFLEQFGQYLIMKPLDKFLSGLLGTPAGSFDTVEELVQDLIPAIIRRVLGNLTGALTGSGGSDLDQSTADDIIGNIPIIGDIVKVVGGSTSGLTGGMATAAADMAARWSQLTAAENKANDAIALANTAKDAITDLTAVMAAAKATQAWVGNYNDMATVPRVLLTDGQELTKFSPQVTKFVYPGPGTTYYTPIISDREGDLDKFRFITGADSTLYGIDAYFVALMIYDIPAGKFRTIWNPGDIKNAMGSTLSEVSISMGLSGTAARIAPGQILIAAHQQSAQALAQSPRSVAWVPQSGVARTNDVLLPGAYWSSPSAENGISSEVNVSGLNSKNDGIPWFAVSVLNP